MARYQIAWYQMVQCQMARYQWPGTKWLGTKWPGTKWPGTKWPGTKWPGVPTSMSSLHCYIILLTHTLCDMLNHYILTHTPSKQVDSKLSKPSIGHSVQHCVTTRVNSIEVRLG